jgi:hypothetical protein
MVRNQLLPEMPILDQDCQTILGTTYQKEEHTTKYTKKLQNAPNVHKMHQISLKIHTFSTPRPSKNISKCSTFWYKNIPSGNPGGKIKAGHIRSSLLPPSNHDLLSSPHPLREPGRQEQIPILYLDSITHILRRKTLIII